jgi:hypothetical protein
VFRRGHDGYRILAAFSGQPTPEGHEREEYDTLAEIDKLQKILQQQEYDAAQRECEFDQAQVSARADAVRDRLYERMTSGSTSQYEKDFIRLYLQLRDERKRETYRQRYLEHQWYLYARENDLGDRAADSEEFNVERHG